MRSTKIQLIVIANKISEPIEGGYLHRIILPGKEEEIPN